TLRTCDRVTRRDQAAAHACFALRNYSPQCQQSKNQLCALRDLCGYFRTRMQLTGDFFTQSSKVFTVSELTRSIRGTLETKFGAVWVQGEISNYKLYPSGHQYFTLKDQRAQIACVIWRDTMAPLRQPL